MPGASLRRNITPSSLPLWGSRVLIFLSTDHFKLRSIQTLLNDSISNDPDVIKFELLRLGLELEVQWREVLHGFFRLKLDHQILILRIRL